MPDCEPERGHDGDTWAQRGHARAASTSTEGEHARRTRGCARLWGPHQQQFQPEKCFIPPFRCARTLCARDVFDNAMGAQQSAESGGRRAPMPTAASFAVAADTDKEEEDNDSERVLAAVWRSAAAVGDVPLGMVRSAPWNALQPAQSLIEALLLSRPIADSATDALVSGKPECHQFIERFLPGVVKEDEADGTPVAACKWTRLTREWSEVTVPYAELARSHPGDDPSADGPSTDGTSAEGYQPGRYQPVTTKAGGRTWAIAFVAPGGEQESALHAAYPMQLLVRFDAGRQALIYDAFDFKPCLACDFDTASVTAAELKAAEDLMKRTRRQRQQMAMVMPGLSEEPRPPAKDLPHAERLAAYDAETLRALVNWVRYKHSTVWRVRVPLSGVCGARLVTLDVARPHAALPPAVGQLPLSKLGTRADSGDPCSNAYGRRARKPTGSEISGADIEPIAVLVLELSGRGADVGASFASMQVYPAARQQRGSRSPSADWTPKMGASRATRHYIVGDASEVVELANFLSAQNDALRRLLVPPPRQQAAGRRAALRSGRTHCQAPTLVTVAPAATEEVARRALNSLCGALHELRPQHTPQVLSLAHAAAATMEAQQASSTSAAAAGRSGSGSASSSTDTCEQFESCDAVHAFLRRCGVARPEAVNACLKAGLRNGRVVVPSELLAPAADASAYLDVVLLEDGCMACGRLLRCTVRDALRQAALGADYEAGGDGAAIRCGAADDDCACGGNYITGLCYGRPRFDSGKGHNHCLACPEFGRCIGDYREAHCRRCGNHFYCGPLGGRCPCRGGGCGGGGGYGSGSDGSGMDSESDMSQGGDDAGAGEGVHTAPSDSCWDGCLRGVAIFQAHARSTALAAARKQAAWLLSPEVPSEARMSILEMVALTAGSTGALLADLGRALESEPPDEASLSNERLQSISEALGMVRKMRGEDGEDEGGEAEAEQAAENNDPMGHLDY